MLVLEPNRKVRDCLDPVIIDQVLIRPVHRGPMVMTCFRDEACKGSDANRCKLR